MVPVGIPGSIAYALYAARQDALAELRRDGDGGELDAIARTISAGQSSDGAAVQSSSDSANPLAAAGGGMADDSQYVFSGEGPMADRGAHPCSVAIVGQLRCSSARLTSRSSASRAASRPCQARAKRPARGRETRPGAVVLHSPTLLSQRARPPPPQ